LPDDNTYSVVLFESATMAVRAEKVAARGGYHVKLIATPRHLSSDCGVSLRISSARQADILRLFSDKSVADAGIHPLTE